MPRPGEPYYVTTPIYYVNGEPHLGHAYTTIAADVGHAARAPQRRRRVLPHGHRRARRQGGAGRGRRRRLAQAVGRSGRRALPRARARDRGHQRLLHPHHRSRARGVRAALRRAHARARRPLREHLLGPLLHGLRGLLQRGRSDRRALPRARDACRPGRRSATRSSASRPTRDALLARYAADPPFVLPQTRLNEVRSFVEGGLRRRLHHARVGALGRAAALGPRPGDLRLDRRAHQLHLGAHLRPRPARI